MVELAIDALATYRLTRLVTADSLTEAPRRAVVFWAFRRSPTWPVVEPGGTIVEALDDWEATGEPTPKLATLVTCRWCAGVWVAFGVVAARRLLPRRWAPVAEGLASAAAAALLARLESDGA